MKWELNEINGIIACPNCKRKLVLKELCDVHCEECQELYRWLRYTWELVPSSWKTSSDLWPVWEQLQANGLASYTHDPEHNLGVGKRQDCLDFSRFCSFDGLVLDVGCGPQARPTYFTFHSDGTRFFGIDPLLGDCPGDYPQFRALGEFLPFRDRVFDHVVFATSLDHFIDPGRALREAERVCKLAGEIDIWIGETKPDVPRPSVSPEWYVKLKKPSPAQDVFHLKRLGPSDLAAVLKDAGFYISAHEGHRVDDYRTNHFYRLAVIG